MVPTESKPGETNFKSNKFPFLGFKITIGAAALCKAFCSAVEGIKLDCMDSSDGHKTAKGLSGLTLRSRSSWILFVLDASHSNRKPPIPLTATINPERKALITSSTFS